MENQIIASQNSVRNRSTVQRLAARAVAARSASAADDVARLIDAGREVMARSGTSTRPRVADIIAAAGVSNDVFYRHFRSKDDLVGAILEDGADRLASYLAHRMGKANDPAERVAEWVRGVLAQASDDAASTTLAVLWNGSSIGNDGADSARPSMTAPLARLLVEPLVELQSSAPDLDAALIAHATVGRLSDHLWARTRPSDDEVEHLVAAFLAVVRAL